MPLEISARNFAVLRDIRWRIPAGVSALVGPNGSGKTTLLGMPELLRHALERTLPAAIDHRLGGAAVVRNLGAAAEEGVRVCVTVGDLATWTIGVSTAGASVSSHAAESLSVRGSALLRREPGALEADIRGKRVTCGDQLALRVLSESMTPEERATDALAPVSRLLFLIQNYRHYRCYTWDLWGLSLRGSPHSADRFLHVSGANAFAVLRNWSLQRETRPRWEFVTTALRGAFVGFDGVDFEQAGNTVTVSIFREPWGTQKLSVMQESTGFLSALLCLMAVASAEPLSVVAIDEVENSLHPEAIRSLIRAMRSWAGKHDIDVVLATHSPVVLDEFRDDPSHLLVLEPGRSPAPVPVSEMFDSEWLGQFSLGSLYAGRDFGAPAKAKPSNAAE